MPLPHQNETPEPTSRPRRPRRFSRHLVNEGSLVFFGAFAAYLAVAILLDFRYHAFDGDAISRMANGFYVLHSRDPHLAAVGFVWNPLSSIADLPLLAFNSVWPVLASHNVAGTTMSAISMGGAAYQLNSILRDWKMAGALRILLTAFFVLNPLILLFGGNGMSEAIYLFTMLSATRYLLRWLRAGDLPSLVYSAIALAFAYLERSEPVAAAAIATPLVFWVTFVRSGGPRKARMWAALTDVTILVIPILTAFVGWAVVSYVITGQPFGQFTSKYGNSALIKGSHEIVGSLSGRAVHELTAITYIGPLLSVVGVLAIVVAIYRRNVQILGVLAIIGGGLAFTLVSYLTNAIFPWYRYYILVVPLDVLLLASIFGEPSTLRSADSLSSTKQLKSGGIRSIGGVLVAAVLTMVVLVPSIPGTAKGMDTIKLAPDILLYYGFIWHKQLDAQDRDAKTNYSAVEAMAHYLDAQHLPNGDVVVDTADNCIPNVVTNVDNPRLFAIHNDRDFQRVLDDPLTFHSHYLMVQGAGSAQTDAVGEQYPQLGKGSSWAKLSHVFPARGLCVSFSLYRVIGHPNGT